MKTLPFIGYGKLFSSFTNQSVKIKKTFFQAGQALELLVLNQYPHLLQSTPGSRRFPGKPDSPITYHGFSVSLLFFARKF
jgi:hypothetical protein